MTKPCPSCGFALNSPGCAAMHSGGFGSVGASVSGKAHQKIDPKHATRYKDLGPLPVSAQLGAVKDKERYGFTTFKGHRVRDLGNGYYATPKGLPVIHDERSRKHFGEMFNASDD